MESISPQRMATLRKQTGIDKLHNFVAQDIQAVQALAAPLMTQLKQDNDFEQVSNERHNQFEQLFKEGNLVEAYRYGHAALKSGKQCVGDIHALQAELTNAIHTKVDTAQKEIHNIREPIADDLQELPFDIRDTLGKEALESDKPLYRTEAEAVSQTLQLTTGVSSATQIDNLKRDLSMLEHQARLAGVALPSPESIEPLEPLPSFNTLAPAANRAAESAGQQAPSL